MEHYQKEKERYKCRNVSMNAVGKNLAKLL